ncbi:MAG: M43 family zinc metalloprotease [Chitinophagaceae bacterium]|nr:M43 family zinc metalloprotease [Chitinophagaceae bacterium]
MNQSVRKYLLVSLFSVAGLNIHAQRSCGFQEYAVERLKKNPSLYHERLINFAEQNETLRTDSVSGAEPPVIQIPVVVHVLYHFPYEKLSDSYIMRQIEILNECFRRKNADTVNTPQYFRPLAADCRIEFHLAKSDPRRRSTQGIVRKYTPVKYWNNDDKMKFSASMGSDAWDSKSYLNIWVCNLERTAGYSSLPGDHPALDGIVIDMEAFGLTGLNNGYDLGKTLVHEAGHWLGLKHIWGDRYCGDDDVQDTPKQSGYTVGCPTGIRVSCGNAPYGDMYMNYMDLTHDACVNLFTKGQMEKMRSLFTPGGLRSSLLQSKGLEPPLYSEIPLPEEDPKWLYPQLFPNPAYDVIHLDLTYDSRWTGKTIQLINSNGRLLSLIPVRSSLVSFSVKHLPAGVYFLRSRKEDGETLQIRFVKQ